MVVRKSCWIPFPTSITESVFLGFLAGHRREQAEDCSFSESVPLRIGRGKFGARWYSRFVSLLTCAKTRRARLWCGDISSRQQRALKSSWVPFVITVPNIPCALLFGASADKIGTALARWVGVSLLALGIACLPSKAGESHRNAVLGLVVFNAGVTVLFAWVGVVATVHGVLLWPAVILHAIIAGALLPHLLAKGSVE